MSFKEANQQVKLWMQLGRDAYAKKRFIQVFHYFHRALEYAEQRELAHEIAWICRNLGYVHAQQGSLKKALDYLNKGLAHQVDELEIEIRVGLITNKASVIARLGSYKKAVALLEQGASLILTHYQSLSLAPSHMVLSYAGILRMAKDLRKVVALLDQGFPPERIQVEIKGYSPYGQSENG
ncbi:MAG: tetratricopeptide repeat protein [Deltaproteobacteria bacterium]|nr:tetratricopeptide repeat protein [Deltaproteobacteria bacterium]MBW1957658.1 tetratricopeptide repeat protein [Deltaproteobacteria bacterium]MBW2088233.1 tetratricopeptide repeat protein [Deltaproteobacteria bacterium]MBW2319353.1 tetratricopeptide repeat protein [Deltaproteobacteria bacterium]